MNKGWDQSRFDTLLEAYLKEHYSNVWPRALNKKGFFIALGAIPETPKVEPGTIERQLARVITAKRADGTSSQVPVGFVIAAKRASKRWLGSKQFQRAQQSRLRGGSASEMKAWLSLAREKFRTMVGGRKRASGFLRVGWVSVLKALGPQIGMSYSRGESSGRSRLRGNMKGDAKPAASGKLVVTISNSAQAKSDKAEGLIRFGTSPLQRAFDKEAASMAKFLGEEMEPEAQKFNHANR